MTKEELEMLLQELYESGDIFPTVSHFLGPVDSIEFTDNAINKLLELVNK